MKSVGRQGRTRHQAPESSLLSMNGAEVANGGLERDQAPASAGQETEPKEEVHL